MKKIYLLVSLCIICHVNQSQIIIHSFNQLLAGPGQLNIDINNDASDDYTFDILTLSPGVYAARVLPIGSSKILDNSTYGYPDTLNFNDSVAGYFHSNVGVLGTFNNAGQFRGAGNKYLGIKLNSGGQYYSGWIELNCNFNRDSLKIISCGYNSTSNALILAGQTTTNGVPNCPEKSQEIKLFPNPCNGILNVEINPKINYEINLTNSQGDEITPSGNFLQRGDNKIDLRSLPNGTYFLKLFSRETVSTKRIVLQR